VLGVAVVLLDIDNFKLVNDSLGHGAGDELLIDIAPRLQRALRPSDTIARLGGDEFVVLLEQVPHVRAAARVAERLVAALEIPFQLAAGEHFAKASLGIAIADGTHATPASLVRDADAAMYQAKASGRGSFEVFDRAMRQRALARLSLENDLRRALERDELHLEYQPIVALESGSVDSVEALLRWHHPQRGAIAPGEFVPVAEECGLIEPIGRWVLESACAQAASWRRNRPIERALGISINLSVRQLMQSDLEATVARVLQSTRIEPSSLCLEITESVLLDEPELVHDTITRIARLGVRFVLDDFGTGYSSLAYLTRLPIDGLKVDRSFVDRLGADERSTAITTAIVRMAQALSLEVIAEGVETELQAHALQALGCGLAQGFCFYPPLAAGEIPRLLGQKRARPGGRRGRPEPSIVHG
jgi:diguanylate cyclase (GGDEF)-like protein